MKALKLLTQDRRVNDPERRLNPAERRALQDPEGEARRLLGRAYYLLGYGAGRQRNAHFIAELKRLMDALNERTDQAERRREQDRREKRKAAA